MEIYQLRSFVTVAHHGHVTRAAHALHLTQSTISGQIKALETHLGVVLFLRTNAGMTLTQAGQQLLPRAQELLAGADALLAHARRLWDRVTGTLKLCTINDGDLLLLPRILGLLHERHPDIGMVLRHGLSGWALNEVKVGQGDAGFFMGPLRDDEVNTLRLREIRYCVVVPNAWADKVRAEKWRALGALPWIWVPTQGSYPRLANQLFERHGIAPLKIVETDRELTTLSLVAAGVGVGLLREDRAIEAAREGRLFLWNEGWTTADLSLMWLASRESDPLILVLLAAVREVWDIAVSPMPVIENLR